LIIILHQGAHSYTHKSLLEEEGLCEVKCRNYDWLINIKPLPKATYIFTDRERMDLWELRVLSALYKHLENSGSGYRVLNNPLHMLNRRSLLRSLYVEGINEFNAYSLTERRMPEKFPVFIRREHDHSHPLTDLLNNQKELDIALKELKDKGEPDDGVLIIEYAAEPIEGTLFRKLAAYRVGDEIIFFNTVHEHNWLVKYGTKNSASDAMYLEEQEMILSNRYADIIRKVFDIAMIEYGRVDFGLVNGKVQVYEINTNPTIVSPKPHPHKIREENQHLAWNRYCKALTDLDTSDQSAKFATDFRHEGIIVPEVVKPSLIKQPIQYLSVFMSKFITKADEKCSIRR